MSNAKQLSAKFLLARLSLCVVSVVSCFVMQITHAREEFFIPFPEDQTLSFLRGITSNEFCTITAPEPVDPVNTITDFIVRVDGTLIVIDHHEDGYESNIDGIVDSSLDAPVIPDSLTTRIYGDGILSNGAAPGVTSDAGDILFQGQVVTFEENIITATQLPDIEIVGATITGGGNRLIDGVDGGDRVFSTETINLTRSQWADGPGTLLAGAIELFPTSQWGNSFTLPVGEDSSSCLLYTSPSPRD